MIGVIGRRIEALWRWCVRVCIFLLKCMWNVAWMMLGLILACMAMMMLVGVGALPVLLLQGYPFAGIFMICLGGLLCLGALSCTAFGMIIRRKKEVVHQDTEQSGGEAAYEQTA